MKHWLYAIFFLSAPAFAATPVVYINNATGSNTQASGAGPATAVFGTGAVTVSASSFVALGADTPDLSGVVADGTHVLWVLSSSGRQYSKIAEVSDAGDFVVTENVWANSESGRTWAIGGKRDDFQTSNGNTKNLFADALAGWTIDIENTGTSYTVNPTITISVGGAGGTTDYITIQSSSSEPPVITSSVNAVSIFTYSLGGGALLKFQNLKLTHTAATRGNLINCAGATPANSTVLNKVHMDGGAVGMTGSRAGDIGIYHSTIKNSVAAGVDSSAANVFDSAGSLYLDNGTNGITQSGSISSFNFFGNVFGGNGTHGVHHNTTLRSPAWFVVNNTFANNGASGLKDDNGATGAPSMLSYSNNVCWSNGAYCIDWSEPLITTQGMGGITRDNFQGNNTSGFHNGFENGSNLVTLTRDPFVDSTNNDYRLNSADGGGGEVRAAGYPTEFFGQGLKSYLDGGAVHHRRVFGAASH